MSEGDIIRGRSLLLKEILRRMDFLRSDEIGEILKRASEILVRRSDAEGLIKENLGEALHSQTYNIFVYISKYNPTRGDLYMVFPRSTVDRSLYELEGAKVIEERNGRYYIIF